ncbi:MAG: AMP nucleosidase [Pseudomonadota bacterium]
MDPDISHNIVHGRDFAPASFDDPDAALARITEIYNHSAATLRTAFDALAAGDALPPVHAPYPAVSISAEHGDLNVDARPSFGVLLEPGEYTTTLTRPDLFAAYYREQLALVMERHGQPVTVGESARQIPLPFVLEQSTANLDESGVRALQDVFTLPDLAATDDRIPNGRHGSPSAAERPLSLFPAERVDYSLARLRHYTGTSEQHFQSFILLTNYQRYVDAFQAYALEQIGRDGFESFVEPGDIVHRPDAPGSGTPKTPQMPAYHLTRPDGQGVTLINIGVGPSNAKTMTDHLAVLRPHCWLMLGHCAGLRRSQLLGDYVLAHGYVRADHVLDDDLPAWVPIPPIAEVQTGLQEAIARVTGLRGREMKRRVRTGTVLTTDNRNWELRFGDMFGDLNMSRAIAVDMESATIAANGFRFRVPYGTLLCVSDKPIHGELKLSSMANAFYRERIDQHLQVGLETMRLLREQGTDQLHSRKLRGFDEPAFR